MMKSLVSKLKRFATKLGIEVTLGIQIFLDDQITVELIVEQDGKVIYTKDLSHKQKDIVKIDGHSITVAPKWYDRAHYVEVSYEFPQEHV